MKKNNKSNISSSSNLVKRKNQTIVFAQLLLVADLCQSNHEAETIVQDVLISIVEETANETIQISPSQVWNTIQDYFELDSDERKTAFRKCQEYYSRQLDKQKMKLLPTEEEEIASFFLNIDEEAEQDSFSSRHIECCDSDKESSDDDEDDDDDDSDDESAYYFMNDDESCYCELCERSNIRLTKHHLIPKSTWPRIKTRLLHAMEAIERGDKNKANVIILDGTNLDHVLTTALSSCFSKSTTTRSSKSHKSKQKQEQDGGKGKLSPDQQQHRHLNRSAQHLRQALSYTCNICRQCHSMVHSTHDNMTLAVEYNTIEKLLQDPVIFKYCQWANKQRVAGQYRL